MLLVTRIFFSGLEKFPRKENFSAVNKHFADGELLRLGQKPLIISQVPLNMMSRDGKLVLRSKSASGLTFGLQFKLILYHLNYRWYATLVITCWY